MNAATTQPPLRSATKAAFALGLLLIIIAFPRLAAAAPIVLNPQNDAPIDDAFIHSVLTGTERFWANGDEVLIALLKTDPQTEKALSRYSGMTASKFKNHWQRIAFSGRGKMPKQFTQIEDLVEYVKRNPGAIAIVGDTPATAPLRRL